jgi:dipeptidyl aminopeptidase/acylaminoacyl peptidase
LVKKQLDVFTIARRTPITSSPADIGLPFEEVSLTTRDGLALAGWYIPGSQPNAIILIHGINANRQVMLPTARLLAEAGYPLLLLDLRGHGQSEGFEITYGYREAWDVQAGIDFLRGRPGIDKVAALGVSMGGAAVGRAAGLDPRLDAVVIQSSYSSLPNAVDDAFERLSIFPKQPFAPLLVSLGERRVGVEIGQVNSMRDLAAFSPKPVLIIHGINDEMFPVRHAYQMFEAAGQPKTLYIIPNQSHGDPTQNGRQTETEYRQQLLVFFTDAFAR